MKRYINPEKIRLTAETKIDENGDVFVLLSDVKKAIEQTPSEDVVEAVRCKDCIYYQPLGEQYTYKDKPAMHCFCHSRLVKENGYCDEGIRKEQN